MGLVDSDTMPLNVSREMLQLHEGELGGTTLSGAQTVPATGFVLEEGAAPPPACSGDLELHPAGLALAAMPRFRQA